MNRFTDYEIEYIIISGLMDEIIDKVIIKNDQSFHPLNDIEQIKYIKKNKVNFCDIDDILIINNNEYFIKEKLKFELWWSPAEQYAFKLDGINEAKEFFLINSNLTYKQLLLKKYKINVIKQNQLESELINTSNNIKTIISNLSDKISKQKKKKRKKRKNNSINEANKSINEANN